MKSVLVGLLVTFLVLLTVLLAAEGIYSLANGPKPARSLTYEALLAVGLVAEPTIEAAGAYAPYFDDPEELADLREPLIAGGVGIGNTPFHEFVTVKAAMLTEVDGCRALKPNLRKTMFFLRSPAFNPFDPISVFHDQGQELDPRVTAFFARYATPPVTTTTNAEGERVTLPLLERPRKVLVAGDSVAFGAMVSDEDTIASQLQARDQERQYVNLGVGNFAAADIVCRLEAAMRRYAGQVDELIYVYCENDFARKKPYGRPEDLVAWLRDFAAREKIAKVVVVFAPYIYTVSPEATRFRGYEGGNSKPIVVQREALMKAVEAAGFRWIDIGTLARQEQARQETQFAFFAFFVDQVHLSPAGTARLVDELLTR